MKPVIDMELTLLGKYISDITYCNIFKNYWGMTYIDGVKVLKPKFTLYPRSSSLAYKKITNILNLSSRLKSQNFQDVEEYYLKFNPDKINSTKYSDDILLGKLNSYIPYDTYTSVTLNIQDSNNPAKFNSMTKEQLIDHINLNYDNLVDQFVISKADNILEDTIGKFVLLDKSQCLDVVIDKINVTSVKNTATNLITFSEVTSIYYTSAIAVQLKFKKIKPITSTSNLYLGIKREQSEAVNRALATLASSDLNESMTYVFSKIHTGITNDIWYKGHLRASLLTTRTLKRHTVAKIIGESLDTGYEQIKVKKAWWQRALAPVLFVVAVFLAPWSGGTSLSAFAAYWAAVAVAFTVLSFAMAKWGDTVSAEYMGKYAKVSGYISAVTGIASFFQNLARNIATQGLKEYVTSSIRTMVQSITNSISTAQSGSLLSNISSYIAENFGTILHRSVSIGNKVASFWMKKRAERQSKIMTRNGVIIEEQQKALSEYTDREYNIGAEDLKLYTKPLTMDNIQFEVDYLYEPSKYNICRPSFITPGLNIRSNKVGK